jgi:hypothetical protein
MPGLVWILSLEKKEEVFGFWRTLVIFQLPPKVCHHFPAVWRKFWTKVKQNKKKRAENYNTISCQKDATTKWAH